MKAFIESYIGRIVAFVLTPILLPVVTAGAVWGQNVLGVDLHGDQLTAFIVTTVTGFALVVYRWLANRGEWEKVVKYVEGLYEAGKQPTIPPTV